MKTLLTSLTLIGMAGTASAGPVLDSLLELSGNNDPSITYVADDENVSLDHEVYTNLTINTGPQSMIVVESLAVKLSDGHYGIQMEGLSSFENDVLTSNTASLSASIPVDLLVLDPAGLMGQTQMPAELCLALEQPLIIELGGLTSQEGINIDAFAVSLEVTDAEETCLADFQLTGSGLTMAYAMNAFSASQYSMSLFSPLGDIPTSPSGKTYKTDISVEDISFSIMGTEQLQINRISGGSEVEADSLIKVARAGYMDVAKQLQMASITGARPDLSELPIADLWNGFREIISEGSFQVSGATIVGDMPSAMSGQMMLAPGAKFDLGVDTSSQVGEASMAVEYAGNTTGDMTLSATITIGEMQNTAEQSLEQIAMSAPVALKSASLSLKDNGIGEALLAAGINIYDEPLKQLTPMIGPDKAMIISEWVAGARDGVASATVNPGQPVPPMMLVGGLMGDWNALAGMLNIKTSD